MIADIVIGMGYGDEGKGARTHRLASTSQGTSLVIRFGGGHQVGHTVHDGKRLYEHHNLGSGTMANVPTYYSEYCTVNPYGVLAELEDFPTFDESLYYHPKAMIATPYDVSANHELEAINRHGSVGVGFGQTIKRNNANYHLYCIDIANKEFFMAKMNSIRKYYMDNGINVSCDPETSHEDFYKVCKEFYENVEIKTLKAIKHQFDHFIFEGHQGVLLDMDYGVFPHVTFSKTTPYNALQICKSIGIPDVNIHLMTRAYHTRHGNGPFVEGNIDLVNNECETNHKNQYQGEFKKSPFQNELYAFALKSVLTDADEFDINITYTPVITCCDQVTVTAATVVELYVKSIILRMIPNCPRSFTQVVKTYSPNGF